jgi:hypothetical protein
VTATTGTLISGSKLTGKVVYDNIPKVIANNIIMVINTGCRMAVSDIPMPFSFSRDSRIAMNNS